MTDRSNNNGGRATALFRRAGRNNRTGREMPHASLLPCRGEAWIVIRYAGARIAIPARALAPLLDDLTECHWQASRLHLVQGAADASS